MRKLEPDKFFTHLDKIGEPEVRKRRAMGAYKRNNLALVDEWLAQQTQERAEEESARNEVSNREQIHITRSAKNAAWAAAIAAIAAVIAVNSSN